MSEESAGADQQYRLARREFIRGHHPDRGGDTAEFITGLAALDGLMDAVLADGGGTGMDQVRRPRVIVVARRTWRQRALTALLHCLHHPPAPPRVK